jgi:ribosome-binding factor A
MPKDFQRSERLASQIQRELSALIRHSLKDPRLAQPSILDVQVTRDLSLARVYFSVLDPADSEATEQALNHAAGFLQHELGRTIKARITPRLTFIFDDTDIRGRSMDELIDSVIAKDKAHSTHK